MLSELLVFILDLAPATGISAVLDPVACILRECDYILA
jgi:hypothetical protein